MNPLMLMKAKKILSLISLITTFLSASIGIYENINSLRATRIYQRAA